MPVESKVKWAKLKVGILSVVAMGIVTVLIFLITGNTNPFESKSHIFTYMNDAAALAQGAPVNLNGIQVGKVTSIILSGSNDPRRVVRIDMEIPESRLSAIPLDSIASISAANVLGTKFINIKKGKSQTAVRGGQEITSLNTAEFEDVVQQGYAVLTSLQGIVDRVDRIVSQIELGKGSIGKLLVDETLYNRVLAVVDSVQLLANALSSDKGTIGKLIYDPELYNQVRGELTRLDNIMQDLQAGQGTAGKFLKDPALYNEMQKTLTEVRQVVADLNAGKGTAGKLLKSDDLHNQIQATIGRIDLMIDKVNSGQGTLGQLLVNSQLYDNLAGSTREMHELFKDFRANPKKFLRIKLSLF
jgi:phospholipid/cholesterol/gamma-HCH transport system substrate-binding protein